jgi:trimethylamine--corrinoid protein Co-methyltransferase
LANKDKKDNIIDPPSFPRLSEEQCRKVHWTSLEILERVGVRLHLEEAIHLLKKAGANVTDGNLVRVPSNLVEKALTTVPKRVVLYDRLGNPVMPVEGRRCFYGPGSDCLNIIDHRSETRRKPVVKDLIEGVTLCDSLSNIDYVMSMLLPSDVDEAIADRYQMEAMLNHTTKPIIFVTYEFGGCIDAIKMAETVMGSAEALRKNPMVACYINVPSGFLHNEDSLQKLLYLASKNLPSLYIPSSTAGITSPITPAGAVALDNAGTLLGLVLSQLKREGAPVVVPGMSPGHLDMGTFVLTYIEPERGIAQAMAHFYGLPMFSLGGASESKTLDLQAVAEATLGLTMETLAGGNIIHDLGYLESGLTFSFAQLVICDEIVSWLKAFFKEFEMDDEALALDVIAEVGPDGQFLNTKHTLKHHRKRWYPNLFERATYESWLEEGGKTLTERTAERIELILTEHKPEPLPLKVKENLRKIVQKARIG